MIVKQITMSLKNPIIRNHQAYGRHLLPGLAYIDLIYQVFGQHDVAFSNWELKNLSIYAPLIIDNGADIVLGITGSQVDENTWQVEVTGQKQGGQEIDPDANRYVTAQMLRMPPIVFNDRLKERSRGTEQGTTMNLEDIYARCRERELLHSGFIQAEGSVNLDEDRALIDIGLGEAARSSAHRFLFHPTLIDGSAVGAATVCAQWTKEEQRLYLPLFFESFRAAQTLQQRCLTRIRSTSLSQKGELIRMTLEFFNPDGEKVAELKNYTMKLVRDTRLIDAPRKTGPGSVDQRNAGEPVADERPGTTSVKEAVDFLRCLLAERLHQPPDRIATDAGFFEMGIDSRELLQIATLIEKRVGTSLPPTLLFEYTSIDTLAAHLAETFTLKSACGTHEASAKMSPMPVKQGPDPVKKDSVLAVTAAVTAQTTGDSVAGKTCGGDIAIIGMAGRYPKADNLNQFWENLKAGRDCIQEIPASRWDWHKLDKMQLPNGKNVSKWGGFIEDADCFDPAFFRISPREAIILDPQERLFLQTCWETMEDAGYTPDTLVKPRGRYQRRPVGVFVGVMHKDYTLVGAEVAARGKPFPLSLNYAPIANRVSYFCNFHGPSLAIDTVCSSSLTALHMAIQSLRLGDCEVALAGGVNLSLHPHKYMTYGMADMHSSDGFCHSFGQGGDGYVSGEGVGAVLLKPLAHAISDGDHIYAVIKGSTINHVGTVSGITVPSPVAQADLIEACLRQSGIHPRSIGCIEAHGTGTPLGDPIELQGLQKAFQSYTRDKQFCAVGSVKSNIGHAESAAGISGLHKLVLQLYHKTLVSSLHSQRLNPYIDFDSSPFYVSRKTEVWPQPQVTENGHPVRYPRRAGITSLGASGSNAHILLEEYGFDGNCQLPALSAGIMEPFVIVPLSARKKDRLHAYVDKLRLHLESMAAGLNSTADQSAYLQQLAYTLQVGRVAMDERIAFVSNRLNDLSRKITAYINKEEDVEGCFQSRGNSGASPAQGSPADEDIREIDYRRLEELAAQWANGANIPWQQCYSKGRPHRVSLPGYPFVRTRYWPQATANGKEDLSALADAIAKQTREPSSATQVPKKPMVALRSASVPVKISSAAKPSGIELPVATAATTNPNQGTGTRSGTSAPSPKPNTALLEGNRVQPEVSSDVLQPPVSIASINETLRRHLAQALFIEAGELDLESKFVDLGLDSIVGVEWVKTVNAIFGTSIKATKVYDYPTLKEFGGYLSGLLNYHEPAAAKTGPATRKNPPSPNTAQLVPVAEARASRDDGDRFLEASENQEPPAQGILSEELLANLRASLAQALYMDEEELDDTLQFVDLGLDSIVGVEWIKAINETYGTDVKATKVYDYPSLREFAGYLQTELSIPDRSVPSLTSNNALRDLLGQVQKGSMNIDTADRLLAQISLP